MAGMMIGMMSGKMAMAPVQSILLIPEPGPKRKSALCGAWRISGAKLSSLGPTRSTWTLTAKEAKRKHIANAAMLPAYRTIIAGFEAQEKAKIHMDEHDLAKLAAA